MLEPPKLDWLDVIALYAFKVFLLVLFLYSLYEVLKKHIPELP